MANFRISNEAVSDMLDIGRYTESSWGIEQSNAYLKSLDTAFHTLAQQPKLGLSCDNVSYGYRKYLEGKHIVFYRVADDKMVEIIRILHQAMNVSDHVK